MARIFISYRRTDTAPHAQLLARLLQDHYPGEIFLDRATIQPGNHWEDVLEKHLAECQALLAVIGPKWLTAQHESGQQLLRMPDDWVRREIETGLNRSIVVIPVLVDGAALPKTDYLPDTIQKLTGRQAHTIGQRADCDVTELAEVLKAEIGAPKGKPRDLVDDPSVYFDKLYKETSHIDIKGVEGANAAQSFRIDKLYTPLTTVLAGEMAQRRVPLQEALKHEHLLLIGDPGAGKSTFLRRIAFAACQTLLNEKPTAAEEMLGPGECPFPIRILASSLAKFQETHPGPKPADPWSPEWMVLHLAAQARERAWGLDGEYFRKQLHRSLLLLDGLDEVPEMRRHHVARMAREAATAYSGARIVATSRPSAYGGVTEIPGFQRVDIGDLDEQAVETFLGNWSRAVSKGDVSADEEMRKQLLAAICSKPEIEEMARIPVMLTTLCVLHWNKNRLPDKRADLYEAVLRGLAEARQDKDGRRHSAQQCLELFRHLAFAMHCGRNEKVVEIGPYDAAAAIAGQFRNVPTDQQHAAAEEFLRAEETDSGIVISRGNSLCFWHQTFQEFLAAQALAGREEDRERILFGPGGRLHAPDWRETVQLLACVMYKQGTSRVDDLLKRILDTGGEKLDGQARCVGLVGRMLADLKSWGYEIRDPRYSQYLDAVLAVFERGCTLDFQTRLEAADALGQAGDPRLDRDNWIRVEDGSKGFRIAKYPVTVQEYRRFVEAGGYKIERYWKAGGFGRWTGPEEWRQRMRFPSRPVVSVS